MMHILLYLSNLLKSIIILCNIMTGPHIVLSKTIAPRLTVNYFNVMSDGYPLTLNYLQGISLPANASLNYNHT